MAAEQEQAPAEEAVAVAERLRQPQVLPGLPTHAEQRTHAEAAAGAANAADKTVIKSPQSPRETAGFKINEKSSF